MIKEDTIKCPKCGTENSTRPSKFPCQKNECGYRFKAFDNIEDAETFQDNQPSVEPKHIIGNADKYIVCFCYRKIKAFRVDMLTDVIDEDAVKLLLRGVPFSEKPRFFALIERHKDPAGTKEFWRIEPFEQGRHNKFCRFLRNLEPKDLDGKNVGEGKCNHSVNKFVDRIYDELIQNELYEDYCWAKFKYYFLPININNVIVGVLACGYIRSDEEDNKKTYRENVDKIPNLIKITDREKYQLKEEAEELHSVPIKDLDKGIQELKKLKDGLQKIGEDNYEAKRRVIEREFLIELDALFSAPVNPDYGREVFKKKINYLLNRILKFCRFEAGIFLTNETNAEKLTLFAQEGVEGSADIINNISINIDEDISNLFKERSNKCYDSASGKDNVYTKIFDSLDSIPVKAVAICPFTIIGDLEGLVLLINRASRYYPESIISEHTEHFINELMRDIVNHIRNFYAIEERKEHLALTYHTMNQSLDTLMAKGTNLSRTAAKENMDKKKIGTISKAIDAEIKTIKRRVKTLYYFTAMGTEAEDYRFDMPFSLVRLIEDIRDSYSPFAETRKINIEVRKGGYIPDVFWDKDKIDVAISNILHNAIKFSHYEKGIRIWLNHKGGTINVSINNFGFGIALEDKDGIFNKFKRSKIKDPRRPIPGSGLGLSIAKRFIEKHKGSIKVTSQKNNKEHSLNEVNEASSWEGFNTNFKIIIPVNP